MAIASEIDFLLATDFQLSHMWDFILIDDFLANALNFDFATNSIAALGSVGQVMDGISMKFKVTSTTLPLPKFTVEAGKSGKKNYITKEYEGDFSLTIMEDTSFSSFNYFRKWMEQVYDFDKNVWKINPPKKIGFFSYLTSNPGIPSGMFMYESVKIKGIEDISNNREGGSPLTLTINLTLEKVVPLTTNLSGLNSAINATQLSVSELGRIANGTSSLIRF